MDTAIHPVPDRVKPSFEIFHIRAHTHMATLGVKWLIGLNSGNYVVSSSPTDISRKYWRLYTRFTNNMQLYFKLTWYMLLCWNKQSSVVTRNPVFYFIVCSPNTQSKNTISISFWERVVYRPYADSDRSAVPRSELLTTSLVEKY